MSDAIRKAQRMQAFLDDEDVQAAFADFEKENYKIFKTAKDDEERRMAQARAQALTIMHDWMLAVCSVGEREQLELDRTRDKS